jgi:hypothetical protein
MNNRLKNLRAQLDSLGYDHIANKLHCSISYLSQIAGPNPTRPITEKTARKIEKALRLKPNSLDA